MLLKSILLISVSIFYSAQGFCITGKTFLNQLESNYYHISSSIQTQLTEISTEASGASLESESEFSIISQTISGEYFLSNSFSLEGTYFFALSLGVDAEVQGIDFNLQYFPWGNGVSKQMKFMGSTIETSPEWSPFISAGASTRDYQFSTVNLKFQGLQFKVGTYWHLEKKYFLKAGAFSQYHLNNNVRTLRTSGLELGLGHKF